MSDTPRTDSCANECGGFEMMLLAGQLERELAAMTAERDALREELVRNDHDIVTMTAAKNKAVGRIRSRADRCPCHSEPFNPDNAAHEGRGPGTCAECESDAVALAELEGA